jgi:hypothetical protein
MSAIWESANWTRQFGIRQTGNRQFGMLPFTYPDILHTFRLFGRTDIVVGRESGYLKIFFYISRCEHVKHFVIDAYL